jgi:integrase
MSARVSLQARVEQYLAERRLLGFKLDNMGHGLASFARYVTNAGHVGPLTVDLMADWARQAKAGHGDRATLARRLKMLRPFTAGCASSNPATEVPDEAVFGRVPGRMTPHVYREPEIVELLAAARQLGPEGWTAPGGDGDAVRAGRLHGAAHLRGAGPARCRCRPEVGVLTIRQSKFGKSRLVPLHPSAVQALERYRDQRARHVRTTPELPFFVGQPRAVAGAARRGSPGPPRLRQSSPQLGWVDRGSHGTPRIHDLRHSFAVRRLVLWHEQGVDINQRMLALSTYLGHVKVSSTYWYLTGVPELMGLLARRSSASPAPGRTAMSSRPPRARSPAELRRAGAVVLHRAPHAAARDEPAHGGDLPRRLRAVPGLRDSAPAQAAHGDAAAGHHAGADPGLPRPPGTRARQRGAHRNARLAALRAFLKFAGHRDVNALHVVEQALGVPMKRFERPMLGFLSREEMLAIIGKPGSSWTSQRDHLLLHMLYNTGARVSEIIGVRWPMSCWTVRPACTCMARGASSARCRCGARR